MAELCRKTAHPPVGCVIMASGLAQRFGSNKLLADFGGRPLLCRALAVPATPTLAGCIFLPGDQPLLQRETLEALITAFAQTQKETERAIFRLGARAAHGPDTVVGSPVLFGCGYFPALRTLPEGKGGSVVLKAHPEQVQIVYAQRREELLDADTPEVLEELSAIAAQWCVT